MGKKIVFFVSVLLLRVGGEWTEYNNKRNRNRFDYRRKVALCIS